MIFPDSPTILALVAEQRSRDLRAEADARRLLSPAGGGEPGQSSAQFKRLTVALGRVLVRSGRRLEKLGAPTEVLLPRSDAVLKTVRTD